MKHKHSNRRQDAVWVITKMSHTHTHLRSTYKQTNVDRISGSSQRQNAWYSFMEKSILSR